MDGVWVRGLRAGYGRRQVLAGLDLELDGGRTLALMGPGGCGKSTLLKILADVGDDGLWFEGEIAVRGEALRRVPQTPPASDHCLASLLATELGGPPNGRLRRIWDESPAAADFLESIEDETFDHLPVGTRRLVSLTVAFARPASMILLDEPTADQDPTLAGWVMAKLRAERGRRTMVVVTHNLELARRVADDVALLVDDGIVETAPVKDFFDKPRHQRTRDFVRLGC